MGEIAVYQKLLKLRYLLRIFYTRFCLGFVQKSGRRQCPPGCVTASEVKTGKKVILLTETFLNYDEKTKRSRSGSFRFWNILKTSNAQGLYEMLLKSNPYCANMCGNFTYTVPLMTIKKHTHFSPRGTTF